MLKSFFLFLSKPQKQVLLDEDWKPSDSFCWNQDHGPATGNIIWPRGKEQKRNDTMRLFFISNEKRAKLMK